MKLAAVTSNIAERFQFNKLCTLYSKLSPVTNWDAKASHVYVSNSNPTIHLALENVA